MSVVYQGSLSWAEFRSRILSNVRRQHRQVTAPDGDVQPRIYFYRDDEAVHMQVIPFHAFSSREMKDALTQAIVDIVDWSRRYGMTVSRVAWVYGMYENKHRMEIPDTPEVRAAIARNEYPPGVTPPADLPPSERRELLVVGMFTEYGITEAHFAEITRHPRKPPRLGHWDSRPDYEWTGLMIDPIRNALAAPGVQR